MTRTPWLVLCAIVACSRRPVVAEQQIVFVCEHGAAKSVVASEYFNKLAAERGLAARAISRGAEPQAALSRAAVEGLAGDGLSPALAAPRPLAASEVRGAARVVAFDCAQPAMKLVGKKDVCWDDVPAVSEDYGRARDAIRAHVEAMIAQLQARPRS